MAGTETTYRRLREDDLEADDFVGTPPDDLFPTERHFEDALVANPDILIEGLWLVGRQIPTDSGRIDLLGIDPEGTLIVFELKLGRLSRGSVNQAIEYAAFLTDLEEDDLSSLIANSSGRSGIPKIADFPQAFQDRFGRKPFADGLRVWISLVSQEYDVPAARSIHWLNANGIGIDHFVLYPSVRGNEVVFDVLENLRPEVQRWWVPPTGLKRHDLTEWILGEASQLDIGSLYRRFYDVTGEYLQPNGSWVPRERPESLGLCRSLSYRQSGGRTVQRECLMLRIWGHMPAAVQIFLFDELIKLAPRKTKAFLRLVDGQPDGIPGKTSGYSFWMTEADWDQHGDEFRDLLAYMGKRWREKIGK